MNFKRYFNEQLSSDEKKVIDSIKKAGVKVKMLKDGILGKRPVSKMSIDKVKDLLVKDEWTHKFITLPAGSTPGSFNRFTKKNMKLDVIIGFDRLRLSPGRI